MQQTIYNLISMPVVPLENVSVPSIHLHQSWPCCVPTNRRAKWLNPC